MQVANQKHVADADLLQELQGALSKANGRVDCGLCKLPLLPLPSVQPMQIYVTLEVCRNLHMFVLQTSGRNKTSIDISEKGQRGVVGTKIASQLATMQATALDTYFLAVKCEKATWLQVPFDQANYTSRKTSEAFPPTSGQSARKGPVCFVEASPFCVRKRPSGPHCMSCRLGAVDSAKFLNLNPRCLMKPWTRI